MRRGNLNLFLGGRRTHERPHTWQPTPHPWELNFFDLASDDGGRPRKLLPNYRNALLRFPRLRLRPLDSICLCLASSFLCFPHSRLSFGKRTHVGSGEPVFEVHSSQYYVMEGRGGGLDLLAGTHVRKLRNLRNNPWSDPCFLMAGPK